jgi:formylglycine-generating enzyme required for sulfatase activity
MAGNVWEWTSDWYNSNYYVNMAKNEVPAINPKGPEGPLNERDPYAKERVIKGGSFLCSASYCASYRISARMATSLDSSQEHLGFRTVATVDMVRAQQGSSKE